MASSSGTSVSVIPPKEKYDVFISFRGKDTRKTFTSHLHAALIRRKVETYIDYRLERGDEVAPALLEAIKKSKISVIVFSENFAGSTWCLDELAYIIQCRQTLGQHVIPIFYDVEPSDVRYQKGSYAIAFAKHERRLTVKVPMWKEALSNAANLSGSDSRTVRNDSDLIEQVVGDVLAKLNRESSSDLTGLIGAEDRIQKILLKLDITPEDVRVRSVVIWGMGGIGKTTLADAVFHGLSSQFETHCFLANVRERSGTKGAFSPELYLLRDELLGKLLGDMSLAIHTRTIDAVVKKRLRCSKVLVVLDDVNDSSQLTFLVGEVPFGPGSRIIITTRDMQPVKETLVMEKVVDRDVEIYEVKELNGVESLQLFHSNAPTHSPENLKILNIVVDYAAGIPLVKILRSLFLRCKRKEELELMWNKLKKFPSRRLQNVYRVSYDELERNEREIFLDIACFHQREKLCDVKSMLAACGLFPDDGIEILIDMSLISIIENRIWMHDVIQEMGWEIVREECTEEPGRRSRLHNYEDISEVLKTQTGTAKVKSISSWNCYKRLTLGPQAFTGMHNLRFLQLKFINLDDEANLEYLPGALQYLYWDSSPLKSLPSKFCPNNLVELHMPGSQLKRLWNKGQNPENLKRINLSHSLNLVEVEELSNCVNIENIDLGWCQKLAQVSDLSKCAYIKSIDLRSCYSLVQVPDLSKSVSIESINLRNCASLVQVPSYFRHFSKLTDLNLGHCGKIIDIILPKISSDMVTLDLSETAIEELPPSIWSLEKLVKLNLHRCRTINFPSSPWKMKSLQYLTLSYTEIETVPSSSFMFTSGIISLDLSYCHRLVSLPTDICKLKSLETLDLSGCSSLTNFPEILEPMERLCHLKLKCTKIKELPSSVENLIGLGTLDLDRCQSLELLPNSFCNFNRLMSISLGNCVKLKKLPLSLGLCSLASLSTLYFKGCKLLEEIPDCFTNFPALEFLDLSGTMIKTIPSSINQVFQLRILRLSGCKQLQSLPVLPCLLQELYAQECTSLKTVSISVTAQTQGFDAFDQMRHKKRNEIHSFHGCVNLDKNSRSNLMEDAHFRIMRLAAAINLKLVSGHVTLTCPGINGIPKWFSCQTEGSSMNVKLPLHWFDDPNFLGIALCSAFDHDRRYTGEIMILKTNNGESHTVDLTSEYGEMYLMGEAEHVFVRYIRVRELSDEARWCTEASFDFYTETIRVDGSITRSSVGSAFCMLKAKTTMHGTLCCNHLF